MKKLIISFLSIFLILAINAQASKTDVLQDLEKTQPVGQELKLTATTTAATRLFGAKDDLTSVIMILPKGSVVDVIASDSTYFHVLFEDYDGYIFRRHALLNETSDISKPVVQKVEPLVQKVEPVVQEPKTTVPQEQQQSRFTYLENKYGTGTAAKLIAGKIWKGINSEMITDSWGKPQKTNRIISGNTIKEEWIYKNSWLYLEDDVLMEWGPLKN